jgi:uncharacterized protein YbjT (DUF2867 family)
VPRIRSRSHCIETLSFAAQAGVRHIVRHSLRGAEENSSIKIARWHAASQDELEKSGVAWTHLQPVFNMQNFLCFARPFAPVALLGNSSKTIGQPSSTAHDQPDRVALSTHGPRHRPRMQKFTSNTRAEISAPRDYWHTLGRASATLRVQQLRCVTVQPGFHQRTAMPRQHVHLVRGQSLQVCADGRSKGGVAWLHLAFLAIY